MSRQREISFRARNQFQNVLAKEPNHVDAILGMGLVHLQSHEFEQSLNYFKQLKKLTPNSMDVDNYLGVLYTELKRTTRPVNIADRRHQSRYETPENAYANLALLELKLDNLDAALRYIKKGLKRRKFRPAAFSEGRVYESQKNGVKPYTPMTARRPSPSATRFPFRYSCPDARADG
jgi:Tfp pilus assembly protein PilF